MEISKLLEYIDTYLYEWSFSAIDTTADDKHEKNGITQGFRDFSLQRFN